MYRHQHIHYPAPVVRVASAIDNVTEYPMRVIGGVYSPAGDAYFLPYDNDFITSVRLPSPPGVGITLFWTANLSGCRFYVDQINGSTDLMVYHANARSSHPAPPNADADFQWPTAGGVLDQMHINARNDLAPLVFNPAATCAKAQYFGQAAHREQMLRFQGYQHPDVGTPHCPRAHPTFGGGCTIVGLVVGGAWQFWYQCWGTVDYKEPDTVEVRRLRPNILHAGAVHRSPLGVLGYGQIL